MKRTVPLLIAAATGFVLIATSFVPPLQGWGEDAMAWFNILAAIAFILGGGNLLKMHLQKISNQRAGWGYSLITLVAFLVTLAVGLFKVGATPSSEFPNHPWAASYEQPGTAFWWIFEYVFTPLNMTVFGLLAFFIASAAFRAFRAKNTEAIILLVTAFIVLWGRTYAGVITTEWLPETGTLSGLRLEKLSDTIMSVFNMTGMRAIMIGIALGIVSTSLKVLLGVDRSYLGSDRD